MAQKVIGGGQSHMTIQHARDVGRYRSDFWVDSSHFINIQINFQQKKNLRISILSLQDLSFCLKTKRLCDFGLNFKLLSKPVQIIFQLPQCYPGYQWKFYYETCHTDFLVSIQSPSRSLTRLLIYSSVPFLSFIESCVLLYNTKIQQFKYEIQQNKFIHTKQDFARKI